MHTSISVTSKDCIDVVMTGNGGLVGVDMAGAIVVVGAVDDVYIITGQQVAHHSIVCKKMYICILPQGRPPHMSNLYTDNTVAISEIHKYKHTPRGQ